MVFNSSPYSNTSDLGKLISTLNDVSITNPVNSQALLYNSSSGKWENATVAIGIAGGSNTNIQFNNSSALAGSNLFILSQQSSPANGLAFTLSSSGTNPKISPTGSAANIGLDIFTKGTGIIDFKNASGSKLFEIQNPTGTLDRYLFVAAADNTSLVEIGIDGSPTNASLQITPKGNGVVNIAPSGSASSDVGEIRLFEGNNGAEYVGLKSPNSITTAISFTLPSLDGSAGDILTTNGAKVLSFLSPTFASGNINTIQINDGSNKFTSDALFVYDPTTKNFGIGIASPNNNIQLHEPTAATASYIQLTNNTTGFSSTDGSLIGLTSAGLLEIRNQENSDIFISTNNTEKLRITATGSVIPGVDGTQTLGSSSKKWMDVYGVNSAINTSDARHKTQVQSSVLGLEFIKELNPVSYVWTQEGKRPHYGFIAQEIEQLLVQKQLDFAGFIYDNATDTYGLRYDEFIAPIVKAIQELNNEIQSTNSLHSVSTNVLQDVKSQLADATKNKESQLDLLINLKSANEKIQTLEEKIKHLEGIEVYVENKIKEALIDKEKKGFWQNLLDQIKKTFGIQTKNKKD